MTWHLPSALTLPDTLALAAFLLAWLGIGWLAEHPPASRPSVSSLMERYRHDWMQTFVTRQPRLFDAQLIDSLRQASAFLASASMIAIGGGAALIGNAATVQAIAADLPLEPDGRAIGLRLLLPVLLVANALLKFIWSHRLFGYCAVLMAAVPNDPADPRAFPRAAQAAEINITAAKSFNRGLHSIHFALASLGWLFGPWGLAATTLLAAAILIRREFASTSREVIMRHIDR